MSIKEPEGLCRKTMSTFCQKIHENDPLFIISVFKFLSVTTQGVPCRSGASAIPESLREMQSFILSQNN